MKLTPIVTNPKHRELCAFDVQGDGGQGLVVASLTTADNEIVFDRPKDLVDAITARRMRGRYIYSHRLTYDAGVLVPWLPEHTCLLFVGERLFKGRISRDGKHNVYLADSSGMWGGLPLTRIAAELGMSRLPPPDRLIKGRSRGRSYPPTQYPTKAGLHDFTAGESRIVLQGMALLQGELSHLGGELKNTLGATAVDLFRRQYLGEEYYTPFLYRNDFARRAYYGGRCEPYVLGWWDCVNVYDFHSHYPAQMLGRDYPDPNALIGPRCPGRLKWIMEYEGCSDCIVDVPHSKYPPLPCRVGTQTYFPVGVFRGVWCHNELRYAMSQGVKVKRVCATLYSEERVRPFDGYVSDLWQRRQELKAQGSPRARVYKLLLNNLAGKFGQREEGGLKELMSMGSYWQAGARRGVEFMELRETVYAKVPLKTTWLPPYIIVPWAAYVTAYARIALHQAMLNCPGPVLYVDTDSIYCFSDLKTGDSLGEMGLQAEGVACDFIAPKMYDLVYPDGRRYPVAKGVPEELAGEYCTHKEIAYLKALNWCEAARMKMAPSTWVEVKRRIMHTDPKRKYKRIPGFRSDCWISEPLVVNSIAGYY